MSERALYGCIEAGGTKFVAGLIGADRAIRAETRVPTTTPGETLPAVIGWLRGAADGERLAAIGIASFGPVRLDRAAPDWGHFTTTPKPGWAGADMAGPFARAFGCPIGFDTDVNGAAIAESRWGAGAGLASCVYVTVGTGIGGGAVIGGRPVHGLGHPEMGHIAVARHPEDAGFAGICPYHGDCLEGLASGTAIKARWGASLGDLGADHPAHAMEAFYLAQLVVAAQALLAPERIVLGGGVMATPGLREQVAREAARRGAGYFAGNPALVVAAPALGERSGLLGALALALEAGAA